MTGGFNFRDTYLWGVAKRHALDPCRRIAATACYAGRLPLMWCRGRNWGDALSPVLAGLLSDKRVVHLEGLHFDRYLAIGSILGSANERAEVWGSGFIRENETVIAPPRAVHAVRGPLSRMLLLEQGVECPEIYGDPALLLPRFYSPKVAKRYAVGVIPHYADKGHPWLKTLERDPQVLTIDIEAGIFEFVREVLSCDVVLSSSLHGLICADAYGVANTWIEFSDAVVGGGFKFRDYRLSIGADEPTPVRIDADSELSDVVALATKRPLRIDLRKLILACPFLSDDLRRFVLSAEPSSCDLPAAIPPARRDCLPIA